MVATLNEGLRRGVTEVAELVSAPDRRDLVAGIEPIIAPNYLKFVSVPPAPPFVILFDSFAVQRVSSQRRDQLIIHYTNGAPLVDVFNSGPEVLTVAVTIPDTAPFYTPAGGGYLGESVEYFRALYDKYFRATGALGSIDKNTSGYVEFWSKGRVTRGYLLRLALDRQANSADVNDLSFEMFVTESIATSVVSAKREVA